MDECQQALFGSYSSESGEQNMVRLDRHMTQQARDSRADW